MILSIIIPCYNTEKYVKSCIDTIINQINNEIELILIDDGSSDNTGKIIDIYKYNTNIKIIHTTNKGVAEARNIGIEKAKGEYIWFVDSDDNIIEYSINNIFECIYKYDFPDMISFGIIENLYNNKQLIKSNEIKYNSNYYHNKKESFVFLQNNNLLDLVADKIIKRNIITDNKINFKQENIPTEDHLFFLDIFPFIDTVLVVNDIFYIYNLRTNQSSSRKIKYYKFPVYSKALHKIIFLAKQYNAEKEMYNYCKEMYLYYIIWEYELLNNKSCNLNLIERYKYFKKTFKNNDFDYKFKIDSIKQIKKLQINKFEKYAIINLVFNQYIFPATISFLCYLKRILLWR